MKDLVKYSPELCDAICAEIIDGKSLRTVCKQAGMPSRQAVQNWLRTYPDFKIRYDAACVERAEAYAEEIIDIADDSANDYVSDGEGGTRVDLEHIARARLRVDTRKWICAKMKPRRYGEKVEHTIAHRQAAEMTEDELERIAAGGSAGTAESTQGPQQPPQVH